MNLLRNIWGFIDWLYERRDHNAHFRAIVTEHEELLRR